MVQAKKTNSWVNQSLTCSNEQKHVIILLLNMLISMSNSASLQKKRSIFCPFLLQILCVYLVELRVHCGGRDSGVGLWLCAAFCR